MQFTTPKLLVPFLLILGCLAASTGQSAEPTEATEYYTINEATTNAQVDPQQAAFRALSLYEVMADIKSAALSLLRWTLHAEAPVLPKEHYNRRLHFGRWINDPNDQTCYNTRAKVLLRDTESAVSYKATNPCVVDHGTWADPYTGSTFTDSHEIQIDHMVPLKDAYDSGAWEWNYQTRCLYANFLGNSFHLISSNGTENMRKGDSAPDEYVPPNKTYQCQYLENWLKIKLIWKLKMTPSEVNAIRQKVRDNNCDPSHFSLSDKDLRAQRSLISDTLGLCPAR
jgi:hypothetical protein